MIQNFFYHPRMLSYNFGPRHPLQPIRLHRAVSLLEEVAGLQPIDPGPGREQDALRVHSMEYVEAVRTISAGGPTPASSIPSYGFGAGDNPPFQGMYEASLAYVAGSAAAAQAVADGAQLAFGLAGGLHHAHRARASGFCIFDDPAIAIDILRETFPRVAYVDIDLHHGDGVQGIFLDDPDVLTCSIHESGRSLFPGTGFVEENGKFYTSLNVPLEAHTTGENWIWAFQETVIPALKQFRPGAIVLQMGTDPHYSDPLGHLDVAAQDWLEAVREIKALGIPIVAVGGGGYSPASVPRMWAAAVMILSNVEFEDRIPEAHDQDGKMRTFFDPNSQIPRGRGREEAERVVRRVRELVLDPLGDS